MKISLFQIGKTEDKSIGEAIKKYEKRLKHYISFQTITIPGLKNTGSLTPEQYKEKEAETLLKHLSGREYIILLDERGEQLASVAFSDFLRKQMNRSFKEICFIIGGPFGVSENIKKIAHYKLALSRMTFPHELIRLIFLEQLYRAMSILRNEKYHNE